MTMTKNDTIAWKQANFYNIFFFAAAVPFGLLYSEGSKLAWPARVPIITISGSVPPVNLQ